MSLGKTPEYRTWDSMKRRCEKPHAPGFWRYGGRGIKVCERWLAFENFLADMGPRPSPRHSLDRINNDGDYEPSNCRWATASEQQRNKRNTCWLTHNGETLSRSEWAERLGIPEGALKQRLRHGWPLAEALTRPATGQQREAAKSKRSWKRRALEAEAELAKLKAEVGR